MVEPGVIAQRLETVEGRVEDHETRLRSAERIVFEARGAWRFALWLGVVVGGGAAAIVTAVIQFFLRGHGS